MQIIKMGQRVCYLIVAINYAVMDLILDDNLEYFEKEMGLGVTGTKVLYQIIIFSYVTAVFYLIYFSLMYRTIDNRATSAFYFLSNFIRYAPTPDLGIFFFFS